jgi:serine/threonine protein kinase
MAAEIQADDVKPANVILSHDSRGAILCDFGLAASSTVYSNAGTPNYIALEYLRGWDERFFSLDISALLSNERIVQEC